MITKHLRFLRLAQVIVLIILLSACGKSGGEGSYKNCRPGALVAKPANNSVWLTWKTNCAADAVIGGYNFYITPADKAGKNFPRKNAAPHNWIPFPGDNEEDRRFETAEVKGLTNGVRYVGVVRTILDDGGLSKPSNVAYFTAMPSGEFTLVGRYKGDTDGFALAKQKHTRADAVDNDLFFLATKNGDYICSPSRLGAGLKDVKIYSYGKQKSLQSVSGADLPSKVSDKVPAVASMVYELVGEGKHSLIRIVKVEGSGADRKVTIEYMAQTVPGAREF